MKLRIIATGKDFAESNRISMLCQQVTVDELGFQTLGAQFHWELMKDTVTPEIKAKLQELCDNKTIIDRPFKLQEAVRNNPTNGEVTTKLIATM